ncbi:MAG: PAC2 family protein [Cellulomonadaceae bacterium]
MTSTPDDEPVITGAVMLAAFEGWNDAGSAASAAMAYLIDVWDAEKIGELDPEEFHDFQVNRPVSTIDADGRRDVTWPATTIYRAAHPTTGQQVLLVHGIEPSMRWRTYCTQLLDQCTDLSVSALITLGALLADVPHTRPIPVSATSTDPSLQALLDIEPSSYEGPTGIVGVLQHMADERRVRTLALWAAVPHYVAHPPSPKATLAILVRIEELLGTSIPLGDLPDEAEAWQLGVDELASEDAEIAEYVAKLEEAKDTAELPEASGEAIAREFERFLRRRDRGTDA